MLLNYPDKVVQLLNSSEHNQFHIKITFTITTIQAHVQTFNQFAIYLPSPVFSMTSYMWHLPDPVHLTALL